MRIAFLVFNLAGMGGTSRSAITQANALAARPRRPAGRVTRSGDRPHYWIDTAVASTTSSTSARARPVGPGVDLDAARPAACTRARRCSCPPAGTPSSPPCATSALEHALPRLDADVLVTVTPGLLAAAIQLLPPKPVVVHQEHRSSSDRTSGLEPLLTFAPARRRGRRAHPGDGRLAARAARRRDPRVAIMPNPLPHGLRAPLAARQPADRRGGPAGGREAVRRSWSRPSR